MDEVRTQRPRTANPRRRKKTQLEIFKEAYLPSVIVCVALLLILIFIIGSITRAIQHRRLEEEREGQSALSSQQQQAKLNAEAERLMKDASALAAQYDYDGAVALLDTFSGNKKSFKKLSQMRDEYIAAKDSLVLWQDNSQVLNLSFHPLIADPSRAFSNKTYGTAYNRNFVTTTEFTKILQSLYQNDYVLVSLDDLVETEVTENGYVRFYNKTLYLPSGKKPVILTETQVNYNIYMVDGDDADKLPDKDGAGFASRLLLDENGNLSCEIVNADGSISTGPYDLVPILESFIATHPDFSYKGARAILAVSGYDGLFGYRTMASADSTFGEGYRDEQISMAKQVIAALRDAGYDIACYTYNNTGYGTVDAAGIKADLSGWTAEVLPILGDVDIMVYAKSDISNAGTFYTNDKFNVLDSMGFRYYLGFSSDGKPWAVMSDSYMRQGRMLVTGSNLAHHADWFDGMFDPKLILDPSRGTVPQ